MSIDIDKVFNKLGGRKFVFAMVIGAAGTAIELKTDRGMSMAFAGLLATVYTTFAAANAAITRKYMDQEQKVPNETTEQLKIQVQECIAQHQKSAEELKQLGEQQAKLGEVIASVQTRVVAIVEGLLGKK